jgi:hypothetical protein
MGSHNFGKIWIRIRLKSRTRIKVKSRIWFRIRINDKIQELWRLKIGTWRAVDAHKGGIEAQNGAVEPLYNVFFIGVANSRGARSKSAAKLKIGSGSASK